MKKVLFLVLAFVMMFQVAAFADYSVTVDSKSETAVSVSVNAPADASAVGIWVDLNDDFSMANCVPATLTFVDGVATASYTGSFANLKFLVLKDFDNIMPLCDATDIVLDEVIFDQPDGIEDLGDIED